MGMERSENGENSLKELNRHEIGGIGEVEAFEIVDSAIEEGVEAIYVHDLRGRRGQLERGRRREED